MGGNALKTTLIARRYILSQIQFYFNPNLPDSYHSFVMLSGAARAERSMTKDAVYTTV